MELFNQIFKYLTTVWYVWELIEVINFKRWGDLRTDMLNLGHCYELYWLTEVIWTKKFICWEKSMKIAYSNIRFIFKLSIWIMLWPNMYSVMQKNSSMSPELRKVLFCSTLYLKFWIFYYSTEPSDWQKWFEQKNSSAGRKVWKLHIQISDLYSNCLFELCFDQICTAWCKKILACSLNLARFYFAQPCIWNFEYFFFYRALNLSCTGSLSHLRIMLPKNSSRPSLPNGPLTQLNSY